MYKRKIIKSNPPTKNSLKMKYEVKVLDIINNYNYHYRDKYTQFLIIY